MLEAVAEFAEELLRAAIRDAAFATVEAGDQPLVIRALVADGIVFVRVLAPGHRMLVERSLRVLVHPLASLPILTADADFALVRPWLTC